MSEDFNNTLNLPKTDFPMRGNLPQREPEMLDKWEQDRLYYALSEKNKGKPSYTLHERPSLCKWQYPYGYRDEQGAQGYHC